MTEHQSITRVNPINTDYTAILDPPLVKQALEALLREQRAKYYRHSENALKNNLPCPDRKDYRLPEIEALVKALNA